MFRRERSDGAPRRRAQSPLTRRTTPSTTPRWESTRRSSTRPMRDPLASRTGRPRISERCTMASCPRASVKNGISRDARRECAERLSTFSSRVRESIRPVSAHEDQAADDLDVIVIGGGITGCAVARDAAARGLTVLLLRTARSGRRDQQPVDEAAPRRPALPRARPPPARARGASRARDHRPVGPGARPPPTISSCRSAAAYFPACLPGASGWRSTTSSQARTRLRAAAPSPRSELAALADALSPGWSGGIMFADRQTDDTRLTVAIARDARRRGASIRVGAAVTALARNRFGLSRVLSRRGRPGVGGRGALRRERRRTLVRRGTPARRRSRSRSLSVSRGAHLVLPVLALHAALLLPGAKRGHRLFAIPWRGVGAVRDDRRRRRRGPWTRSSRKSRTSGFSSKRRAGTSPEPG